MYYYDKLFFDLVILQLKRYIKGIKWTFRT